MKSYILHFYGGPAGVDIIASYGPFFSYGEAVIFGNEELSKDKKYGRYEVYCIIDPYFEQAANAS